MTPLEALTLLDQVVATVALNRHDMTLVNQAITVLNELIMDSLPQGKPANESKPQPKVKVDEKAVAKAIDDAISH